MFKALYISGVLCDCRNLVWKKCKKVRWRSGQRGLGNEVKTITNMPFLKSGQIRHLSILVADRHQADRHGFRWFCVRRFTATTIQMIRIFLGQVTIFCDWCGFPLLPVRKTLSGDVRTHIIMGRIMSGQTAKSNGAKLKRNSAKARNKKDFFKGSVDRRNTLR